MKKQLTFNRRPRKKALFVISALLICSLVLNVFLLYKGNYIQDLYSELKARQEYNSLLSTYTAPHIDLGDKTSVNYLCIGNSITVHPVNSYWSNVRGMAASTKDSDYPHVLASLLNSNYTNVLFSAVNFAEWEIHGNDRGEFLSDLDEYLSTDLDFVIIQLGDNATSYADIEADYEEMIQYIQAKTDGAYCIVIGEFWTHHAVDTAKLKACENTGASYISLSSIQSSEYRCGKGTVITNDDGTTSTVEHSGVAKHPNDKAFDYIAHQIYDLF